MKDSVVKCDVEPFTTAEDDSVIPPFLLNFSMA
jgi:hypothetical protein